jgi:SP family myo-inositol transporter-like MFS transporter 13
MARLVTFASSFSEGYELIIFSLILSPVIKEFSLTTTGVVLLASVPMAAGLLGYLFMGWFMDVMGRKPTLLSSYVICLCGCALMATAPDVYMLGLGRGVMALGVRSGVTCVSVYMSELSPAEHRGMLVSVEEIYINIGMLAATLVSWVLMGRQDVSWRSFVTLGGFAPALALVLVLCMQIPESPRYMQMWGRQAEAVAVLRSALDGKDDEIEKTLSSWREEEVTMAKTTWADQLSQVLELPGHAGFRVACYCWISRAGSGIVIIGTYFAVFMKGAGMDDETALRWFTIGQLACN